MLSIITATFNSEKTLERTINSVLNQKSREFEYILIDGKSSDNTISIIKSFEHKFSEKGINYKWISEKDTGIYDAWNKGLKLATGEWISFLGSDDYYSEVALLDYFGSIDKEKVSGYDLIYSNVKLVDGEKTIKIIDGKWTWKKFKRYMNIAHVGAFHHRNYFEKHGLFNTSYKIAGDYELLLRARHNLKSYKINKITAIMNAGGVSNKNISQVFKETLIAKNKTAKLNIIACYFDYFLAHIKYAIKNAF